MQQQRSGLRVSGLTLRILADATGVELDLPVR